MQHTTHMTAAGKSIVAEPYAASRPHKEALTQV